MFAVVVGAASLISVGAIQSTSLAEPDRQGAYLVGSGDTLRVRVHEWPGFDGDIVVGANGEFALPIIGTIYAAGLPVGKLADNIAEKLRLSSELSTPPSVVVGIVKYRPFFILGDVETPGGYDFRPGLTVRQAISIAGGYFRPRDTTPVREIIVARGELETNTRLVNAYIVQLARIDAELEGRTDFDVPSELMRYAHTPEISALIRREREVLSANQTLHNERLTTFEQLSKISEGAIESLKSELEPIDNQLSIVREEAERVQKLETRGLVNSARVTSVELSLSRIERTLQEKQTAIIRSQLRLQRERRRAKELKAEYTKLLRDERQAVLSRLKAARALQRRSEQLILAADITPRSRSAVRRANDILRPVTLVRKTEDGNGSLEVHAELDDRVEPGDVVSVGKPAPAIDNATGPGTSESSVADAELSKSVR